MGTFIRLVPECKLTLLRRLPGGGGARAHASAGNAALLYVNCAKNNNSQDIGLDPIMLGILSQFLLEAEGSCVSEGQSGRKGSVGDNYV